MKTFFAVIMMSASVSMAAKIRVPKTFGPANVPVFHFNKNLTVLEQTEEATYVKAKVILRWGLHVYETGYAVYECPTNRKTCDLVEYKRLASYEKCVVNGDSARCYNKYESDSNNSPSENSGRSDRSLKNDDLPRDRHHFDDLPERSQDEDPDDRSMHS